MSFEKTVWRLTKENADFFNIDAGTIEEGKRADITIIDPEQLTDEVHKYHKAPFLQGLERLVNRNEGVVKAVIIGGKIACENDKFSPEFGSEPYGEFLKGKHVY